MHLQTLTVLAGAVAATAPLLAALPCRAADGTGDGLTVTWSRFGRMPDGRVVQVYTLANPGGIRATVMTYGATLTNLQAPDRDGRLANVTLYLDTLEDYLKGHPLFGSVVGRYANRIAGARFPLDGKTVEVEANAGTNHIHGGRQNVARLLWDARPIRRDGAAGVELTHTSPDGHAGFPGTLAVTVRYLVTKDDALVMEYEATTDKPTVVNLTNHAYWNLAGAGSGDVLGHVLTLNADAYLPFGEGKIPTGEIRPVDGTPMDFRKPETIGSRIREVEDDNYDHCYVLNKEGGQRMALAARVVEPTSGRVMEVHTTQPGVQLYTARHLGPRYKAGGKAYGPYHGLCLETQHYPDAPNKPHFPSTVLRPGETFKETTIHRFSVEKQ